MSPSIMKVLLITLVVLLIMILYQEHHLKSEIANQLKKIQATQLDNKSPQTFAPCPTEITTTRKTTKPNLVKMTFTKKERADFIKLAKEEDYIFDTVMSENQINGATIVSAANYGYRNTTLNWIVGLYRSEHTKFVIFCYDEDLLIFMAEQGYQKNVVLVPPRWMKFDIVKESVNESKVMEFANMMQARVEIWRQIALRGHTFLFCDTDLIFLSSHALQNIQFNQKFSFAEILFSVGRPRKGNILLNTGFFYATPTKFVVELFKNISVNGLTNATFTDQDALDDMLRNKWSHPDQRLGNLDQLLYASGAAHFKQKLNAKHEIQPLVVHASIRPQDTKVDVMKVHGYWFLDNDGNQIF